VAQNGARWLTLGGLLGHLVRPGGDPERGFLGMGGAEVARAQTTNMPSLVSVDSACFQLTSGPGSRVSDRPSDRGIHASNVRSPGEGPSVIIHNQAGGTRGAHPERTLSLSITVLCFSKNRNANFTNRRENWSKSLTALGKKLSKNFKIVALLRTQHEVDAVSTPTRTGWPNREDLVAGRYPCTCPRRGNRG